MAKERIDRVLGHMGIGSRREIKEMIRRGRVILDGQPVRDAGEHLDPMVQHLVVDDRLIQFQRYFYLLLHKPAGVITATEDRRQRTVLDLLPDALRHRDLFPVGRLDKDTEGLLVLTTDGNLAHRLLSPRHHVDKRYFVRVQEPIDVRTVEGFAAGVVLEDGYQSMPARLEPVGDVEAWVTIQEGKFHQIKRMFEACGNRVTYLKRLSMGPQGLGDLSLGEARPLNDVEINALYDAVGLARP
jgi:16S rRNA pseudouridine516 synthase